jgi:F-type H+-transporting ATPase subunit c
MSKLRIVFFAAVGLLMSATSTFAQAAAPDNDMSVNKFKALAAGLGFGFAAGIAAIGQSRVAAAAAEGVARNPGASARIQTLMILGLVFIETLVLFTLVVVFAALR